MILLYRAFTILAAPFIPLLLHKRLARGKEDGKRLQERLGHASLPRPEGKLLWIHAASVGEANAALTLINEVLRAHVSLNMLLTTVTLTSSSLIAGRLPERAIHQFAPVDTLAAVKEFLQYWKPDMALWVDSEFWPNLIIETHKSGAVMGIINARMSPRSYRAWGFAKPFIRKLLSCFTLCFAQSKQDAERLKSLGIATITGIGNLKYDAPTLPCNEQELLQLEDIIAGRPVWLAASTHPGEEAIIAYAHTTLKNHFPELLTIITPRHARRGSEIALELSSLTIAQRSKHQIITKECDIYLADTMGELGLFYRLAPIIFMGGSLVPHGGQNPLEAARLQSAIITGLHTGNFLDMYENLENAKACLRVQDKEALVHAVQSLLSDNVKLKELIQNAHNFVHSQTGQVIQITNELQRYFA